MTAWVLAEGPRANQYADAIRVEARIAAETAAVVAVAFGIDRYTIGGRVLVRVRRHLSLLLQYGHMSMQSDTILSFGLGQCTQAT